MEVSVYAVAVVGVRESPPKFSSLFSFCEPPVAAAAKATFSSMFL
jgi:hypothetical protein